jgi:Transcriptional regulatory protein, C terminal
MEFGLLGPLVVRCGKTALPVPHGHQRTLLAVLLLNAGRVVPLDDIAEALRGPAPPPPSAPVTIRNYVRRLRQALGEAGRDRLSFRQHGYLISVGEDELTCPGSGTCWPHPGRRRGWAPGTRLRGWRVRRCRCGVASRWPISSPTRWRCRRDRGWPSWGCRRWRLASRQSCGWAATARCWTSRSRGLARYPPLIPAVTMADRHRRSHLPSPAVGAALTASCMSATLMSWQVIAAMTGATNRSHSRRWVSACLRDHGSLGGCRPATGSRR